MAILPEEIKDNKESDLKKRVDTLYEYVKYMHENLEFYASNKNKQSIESEAVMGTELGKIEEELEGIKERLEGLTFDAISGGTADAEHYKVDGSDSIADFINESATENKSATWVPIFADDKIQHTTKADIVRSGEVEDVSWHNNTLRFVCYGRIVVCYLYGVTYSELIADTLLNKWVPLHPERFVLQGELNGNIVLGYGEVGTNGKFSAYYYSGFNETPKTWAGNWRLFGTAVWLTNTKE